MNEFTEQANQMTQTEANQAAADEQRALTASRERDEEAHIVQNVQVEIMFATNDLPTALLINNATEVIRNAGVPVIGLAKHTYFAGSYLVDVDAVWYIQLGDSGAFDAEAGPYAVSLAQP